MIILCVLLTAAAAFIILLAVKTISAARRAPKLRTAAPMHSEVEVQRYAGRLSRMIQCKTVSVQGSFDDTEFEKLRETVKELFPLVHRRAEKITFSDDCWIYKLPGRDSSRNIMLMSHHDVVPVSGQWQHGGFSGEIAGGKIWGRGTVDTKTPLFAEFSALEELLSQGFEFPCNVYIGSSHNEELGGDGIPSADEYFKAHDIKFELILDEGGAVIDPPLGGMKCKKCSMLAVHEKGRVYFECKAEAQSSHPGISAAASLNPVERVSAFISEVSKGGLFVRRMNAQITAMFSSMGPYCPFPMNVLFANLNIFGPVLKKILPKINSQAGGLIGTTCSFNKIEGSINENCCKALAILRPVDEHDMEEDIKAFGSLAEKYGIELTQLPNSEYHGPADMGKPQFEYTMDCIRSVFPMYPAVPFILPAGTDARTFTDICPCVLRFAPIRLSAQQLGSVHGVDENIDIDAVADAVGFYKHFIENYS